MIFSCFIEFLSDFCILNDFIVFRKKLRKAEIIERSLMTDGEVDSVTIDLLL